MMISINFFEISTTELKRFMMFVFEGSTAQKMLILIGWQRFDKSSQKCNAYL